MPKQATKGEFTGRHMLAVMVAGFGIVIAVNFFMASVAASSFSGTVVENSYVASQKFNTWLGRAEAQQSLGWDANMSRAADGRLVVETAGVPAGAPVTAEIRRPLGAPEIATLELAGAGNGAFTSAEPLGDGRWIVRLHIANGAQEWRMEDQL